MAAAAPQLAGTSAMVSVRHEAALRRHSSRSGRLHWHARIAEMRLLQARALFTTTLWWHVWFVTWATNAATAPDPKLPSACGNIATMGALQSCMTCAATGNVTNMRLTARVTCPSGGTRPCLDLRVRTAPLWVVGNLDCGLHRNTYSQPLLAIAGRNRLVLRQLTFEDAPWPTCFPRLEPPGQNQAMVSIGSASDLVIKSCKFIRGHGIAMAISASCAIAISSSQWLQSDTFGIWADPDQLAAVSHHVHFFGNSFLGGRNNALIGILSDSVFQANEFVHNHHIACFNQSGGQLCLIPPQAVDGPTTAPITFASNRIVNGAITGGDAQTGSQNWRGLSTQAFEINAGIQLRLLYNDAYNNSGWSIAANQAKWPGSSSVMLAGNRMCSRSPMQPPKTTIIGSNESEWLHVGKHNCEGVANAAGGLCGSTKCMQPPRPRGHLTVVKNVAGRVRDVDGKAQVKVQWWVADVSPSTQIKILRDFNLTAMPHPQELRTTKIGSNVSGAEVLGLSKSMAEGGELIALIAKGYGVLDVDIITVDS